MAIPGLAMPKHLIRYDHADGGWHAYEGDRRITSRPGTKREALKAAQAAVRSWARKES